MAFILCLLTSFFRTITLSIITVTIFLFDEFYIINLRKFSFDEYDIFIRGIRIIAIICEQIIIKCNFYLFLHVNNRFFIGPPHKPRVKVLSIVSQLISSTDVEFSSVSVALFSGNVSWSESLSTINYKYHIQLCNCRIFYTAVLVLMLDLRVTVTVLSSAFGHTTVSVVLGTLSVAGLIANKFKHNAFMKIFEYFLLCYCWWNMKHICYSGLVLS